MIGSVQTHSYSSETECSHIEPRWPYGGRGHRDPVPGCDAVVIEELQVRYPGCDTAAITDVSLRVPSGQRVALIGHNGALVQESTLFLLDEPLNAVDEATRDVVDDVLHEHTVQGGTVLVATHDLGRLSESFDRFIYLREGHMEQIENPPGGKTSQTSSRLPTC